jgi:hypothetical protein
LRRADRAQLRVVTSVPAAPVAVWTFAGDVTDFTRHGVHVDAMLGTPMSEDDVYALSRARSAAQYNQRWGEIRSAYEALRRERSSAGNWAGDVFSEEAMCRGLSGVEWQFGSCVRRSDGRSVSPLTGEVY